MVPPQPISMSSACEPRASTTRRDPGLLSSLTVSTYPVALREGPSVRLPDLPRRIPALQKRLQVVLVLEGVHGCPEALVAISHRLLALDHAIQGAAYEVIAVAEVIEDRTLENEEAPVDPDVRLCDVVNASDNAAGLQIDRVERVVLRPHAQEGRDLSALPVPRHHLGKWSIRQPVTVRGEKAALPLEVGLHSQQPLTDAAVQTGVDERYPPVLDVAPEQLDFLPAAGEDEVVAHRLVVGEEELLDHFCSVTEAEDEVLVPEIRVVLHDVPEDRAGADGDHRLRDARRAVAHSQAETAAEENDLHRGTFNRRPPAAESRRQSASPRPVHTTAVPRSLS